MSRVLVVEDDTEIADVIRCALVYHEYEVDVACNGAQGLEVARGRLSGVVLLDVMPPDMDGEEICKRLRVADDVPVIMLTASDSTSERLDGLETNAGDYFTKPLQFDELFAQVTAALRRPAAGKPEGGEAIVVDDLTLNPVSHEVFRGSRPINLTAREFKLLEFLARHCGQVVTKETLFDKVWGYNFDVESDAIKVYVSYLRRKLNANGERDLIHAIRGVGYILKP
jgi:two-component system response regulator MprA